MRISVYDVMLGAAGVSATLIGTFIVGVFFYIDTDMHRRLMMVDTADRYLRSGVRWVFVLYALALFAALGFAGEEARQRGFLLYSYEVAESLLARQGSAAQRQARARYVEQLMLAAPIEPGS